MEEILYNDCSFIPFYCSGSRYFFAAGLTPVVDEGDWDKSFFLYQIQFD